jgi:hypothetical protein
LRERRAFSLFAARYGIAGLQRGVAGQALVLHHGGSNRELECTFAHRFGGETENLRLIDKLNHAIRIGGDQRILLLQYLEKSTCILALAGELSDNHTNIASFNHAGCLDNRRRSVYAMVGFK